MTRDALLPPNRFAVISVADISFADAALEIAPQLEAFADAARAPFLDLSFVSASGPAISEKTASDAIGALERRALVIGGASLEGAVTQTAIQCLMDGYDVFVPADLCWASDADRVSLFHDRLRDNGAIVTTLRQLVWELLGQVLNPRDRAALEALSNEL